MAQGCTKEILDKAPGVNFINPKVAVIARVQSNQVTRKTIPDREPRTMWRNLKNEIAHITRELQKFKPLHKDPPTTQSQQAANPESKIWVRKKSTNKT